MAEQEEGSLPVNWPGNIWIEGKTIIHLKKEQERTLLRASCMINLLQGAAGMGSIEMKHRHCGTSLSTSPAMDSTSRMRCPTVLFRFNVLGSGTIIPLNGWQPS